MSPSSGWAAICLHWLGPIPKFHTCPQRRCSHLTLICFNTLKSNSCSFRSFCQCSSQPQTSSLVSCFVHICLVLHILCPLSLQVCLLQYVQQHSDFLLFSSINVSHRSSPDFYSNVCFTYVCHLLLFCYMPAVAAFCVILEQTSVLVSLVSAMDSLLVIVHNNRKKQKNDNRSVGSAFTRWKLCLARRITMACM